MPQIVWYKGTKTKAEREEITKTLKSYKPAFDALKEHLSEKPTHPGYDSPSWAYKQAHQNGYNEAIRDVLKLIDIKEK